MDKIANYIEEFKTRMRKASWTNSDYDHSSISSNDPASLDFKLLRRFSTGGNENPEGSVVISEEPKTKRRYSSFFGSSDYEIDCFGNKIYKSRDLMN